MIVFVPRDFEHWTKKRGFSDTGPQKHIFGESQTVYFLITKFPNEWYTFVNNEKVKTHEVQSEQHVWFIMIDPNC